MKVRDLPLRIAAGILTIPTAIAIAVGQAQQSNAVSAHPLLHNPNTTASTELAGFALSNSDNQPSLAALRSTLSRQSYKLGRLLRISVESLGLQLRADSPANLYLKRQAGILDVAGAPGSAQDVDYVALGAESGKHKQKQAK